MRRRHTRGSEPRTYFTGQLVAVALCEVYVGRDGGKGPHNVALQHVCYNGFGRTLGEQNGKTVVVCEEGGVGGVA